MISIETMTYLIRCSYRYELSHPKGTTVYIVAKYHTNDKITERLFTAEAQFVLVNDPYISSLRKKEYNSKSKSQYVLVRLFQYSPANIMGPATSILK